MKYLVFSIKIFIVFVFSIYHIPYTIYPTYAADSTPSADIKAKLLEDFNKAVASKAAKLKQEVNRKLKDKAYAGTVQSKSDTSFTLATKSEPKIVGINQDTVFESKIKGKGQVKFSQKTLAEDDYIAALGDADETGALIAKKIVLLPEAKSQKSKAFLWGQIISISDKLLTLKDRDLKKVSISLLNPSAVRLNNFIILSGSYNQNNIFSAEFVYVIPQGGIIKPKKSATPSAKIGSPSAKPKPTSR